MKLNTKTNMEDLRGVFFIVKGQYRRNCGQSFINDATGGVNHIGGYDPSSEETSDWYMVLDNITFNCICCGVDFDKAVRSIGNSIKRYKTKERYLKELQERDTRNRVSKTMRCIYQAVYDYYGDYYDEYIEEQEDIAYGDSSFKTPLQRSADIKKKIPVKKLVTKKEVVTPSKKEVVIKKPVLKKKLSVKKLSLV